MATDYNNNNAPLSEETTTPTLLNSPSLPFEIIVEILLRLRVKHLLRLRCVCKSWNKLISDPKFARDQLRVSAMNPTHSTGRIVSFGPTVRDTSISSVFNSSGAIATQRNCPYSVIDDSSGSCHGMLYLVPDIGVPILWNPSTGKFKNLPSLESSFKSLRQEHDKLIWNMFPGFGYDHSSDSYKVVAGVARRNIGPGDNIVFGLVHTLSTDSWRVVQGFSDFVLLGGSGQFVSGALNWLSVQEPITWPSVIISLDLGTETFQQLLPPYCGDDASSGLSLGVLKGCLCIIANRSMVCDFWLMKDYGNKDSWTKLFSVPYQSENYYYFYRALCTSDGDDEILLETDCGLVVYNFKSDTFKDNAIEDFTVFYEESLISPCF